MKRFHDDFPALLDGFNLETLEQDPNSIFGLTRELAFNYLNPGWFDFARENAGEPAISERFSLDTFIGDAMTGEAKDYYLEAFQRVLQTGKTWHHDYECSSPQILRVYRQSVYPLYNRHGLVVVNSLVKIEPHDPVDRLPAPPIMEFYTQETGFITQCSNCRRVKRATPQEVWDWVPAWVEKMPEQISHTFCQICFEYYYEFKYKPARRPSGQP